MQNCKLDSLRTSVLEEKHYEWHLFSGMTGDLDWQEGLTWPWHIPGLISDISDPEWTINSLLTPRIFTLTVGLPWRTRKLAVRNSAAVSEADRKKKLALLLSLPG